MNVWGQREIVDSEIGLARIARHGERVIFMPEKAGKFSGAKKYSEFHALPPTMQQAVVSQKGCSAWFNKLATN
jgi:hypothetical protein